MAVGEYAPRTAGIRVLHVDDEPEFAALSSDFLARQCEGLEVIIEHRVRDALARLEDEPVDCVVSDFDMPGSTGIEFLEAVRADHPELPFILFTGKGSEEVASEAISAGVTDYLQKSVGTDQYAILANRIEHAVAQYRHERELQVTRRRYRAVFENPLSYAVHLDVDGTVLAVNETAVERLDTDADGPVGDPIWKTPWYAGDQSLQEYVREGVELAAAGESVRAQTSFTDAHGDTVQLDGVLHPVRDEDGTVVSIMGIGRDVTDIAGGDWTAGPDGPDRSR